MFTDRFLILLSTLGLVFLLTTSCASGTVHVVKAPPAARVTVVKTPAPYSNAIRVEGHWTWRGGRYVWVDGYWLKPRRGYVWVQGHWEKRPRGWVWVKGHWRRVR